jgi:hypothetical protein
MKLASWKRRGGTWIKTVWFKLFIFILFCACKVRGSGSVWYPMSYGSGRLGLCTFSPCWLYISGPLCRSKVSGQTRGRLWTICCPQCGLHRLARCCHQRGRKLNYSQWHYRGSYFEPVFRIRIRKSVWFWNSRIRSRNLFVWIQIRIWVLPSTSKKMKNLDFYCLWLLCDVLSLKNDVNVPSKRIKHKNLDKFFLLARRRSLTKRARSGAGSVSQSYGTDDANLYQMSWIRNTALNALHLC